MIVFVAALIGCFCFSQVTLGQVEDVPKPSPGSSKIITNASEPEDMCLLVRCPNSKLKSCKDVQGPGRKIAVLECGTEVLCDTETDNGGWTVIQRRTNGSVDFFRGWGSYKYGFGSYKSEFWMGLEHVHKLTVKQCNEMRIDMKYNNKDYFAKYSYMKVLGEDTNYKLEIGTYSGNAGDSLALHKNKPFSTRDKDNDDLEDNCAIRYKGAWWYAGCHRSNLNGLWDSNEYATGLTWQTLTTFYDSVSFSEMKIRPCY